MKSQELFEIDRQIGQIKKEIQQRQEKVYQSNIPLNRILSKPLRTPEDYLSKKYSDSHLTHHRLQTDLDLQPAKQKLQQHTHQLRIKINGYRNQLKDLHALKKKRNIIRVIQLKQQQPNINIPVTIAKPTSPKKDINRTIHEGQKMFQKIQKEHSILATMKGEKILEVFQEGRARGTSNDDMGALLKKHLGMGLQNTPFYAWMERRRKEEKTVTKSKSNQLVGEPCRGVNFMRTMKEQIRPRKSIYLQRHSQLNQGFQKRLINILRYHSRNMPLH